MNPGSTSDRDDAPNSRWWRSVVAGALASLGSAAAGSLVAALGAVDSPTASVADRTIDTVPTPVRRWAIDTFGTSDKLVLGGGIVVVLAVVGALVGRWSRGRPWMVPAAVGCGALLGVVAAPESTSIGILAVVASALAAYAILVLMVDRSTTPRRPAPHGVEAEPMVRSRWQAPVDRRQFMARAGAISAGTAGLAGATAVVNRTESASVTIARRSFPTVKPGSTGAAPPVPAGASVGNGVEPFITPAADFYRIDTAFVAPRIDLADWTLNVGGAVGTPLSLTYAQLLDREIIERVLTLCCVSNEVGGGLVGTGRFIGVRLADVLEEAGVQDGGEQIRLESEDGWTCGFPTALALDGRDAMIAVGMNGEPLSVAHGFPARIVVPGLYGYVSATKWVTSIDLVGWDEFDGYWVPRGWSKEGPVKTQSRIDVPGDGALVASGRVAVAGVAWAQHRGIDVVEVKVDDGSWRRARLGDEVSVDAWRQWVFDWDATPGRHRLKVRAIDGSGDVQTAALAPVAPDGATGHHTIDVEVG